MSIEWSENATGELQAIHNYVARTSVARAIALARRITDRVAILPDMPFFGSEVREYGDPTMREVFEPPYRILYRVRDAQVINVSIVLATRNLPRTPPTP